ncbi:Cleavage and polyadenylation specificity factor subunit [Entamoeba marina]
MSVPIRLDPSKNGTMINGNFLEVKPLGAGREVGRSCFVVKFMGHSIMLDCGVHPAKEHGEAALPLLNIVIWIQLKYYVELFNEFHQMSSTKQPPKHVDSKEVLNKIDTIKFHELKEVNGMKIWCFNAGHILGAAMFVIEIAGVRILYTGDFSGESDHHLQSAEVPPMEVDVMICESTYGIMEQDTRAEREKDLLKKLLKAQEFELILEEHWSNHKELWLYSIFFFSSIAKKCLAYFTKYTSFMNQELRKNTKQSFKFKIIREGGSTIEESHIDERPCVVLASPGMLQDGFSRNIFERWCTDKNNGVIIPGYCVEGTLAKQIITDSTKPFTSTTGEVITPKCSVVEISFCAHSDFKHTQKFIGAVKPKHLVLIHGENKSMEQLHNALKKTYPDLSIYMPMVTQPIQIPIETKHVASLLGNVVTDNNVNGVFIHNEKEVNTIITNPTDVEKFSSLHSNRIKQQLFIPCQLSLESLFPMLFEFYSHALFNKETQVITIDDITLSLNQNELSVTWENDIITDITVDHLVVLLLEMGISSEKEKPRKVPEQQEIALEMVLEVLNSKFESVMVLKDPMDIKDKRKMEMVGDEVDDESNKLPPQNQEIQSEQKTIDETSPNRDDDIQKEEQKDEIQKDEQDEDESIDNDNDTYIMITENEECVLIKYPSMKVYGIGDELNQRCENVSNRMTHVIQTTFK